MSHLTSSFKLFKFLENKANLYLMIIIVHILSLM